MVASGTSGSSSRRRGVVASGGSSRRRGVVASGTSGSSTCTILRVRSGVVTGVRVACVSWCDVVVGVELQRWLW